MDKKEIDECIRDAITYRKAMENKINGDIYKYDVQTTKAILFFKINKYTFLNMFHRKCYDEMRTCILTVLKDKYPGANVDVLKRTMLKNCIPSTHDLAMIYFVIIALIINFTIKPTDFLVSVIYVLLALFSAYIFTVIFHMAYKLKYPRFKKGP